MFLAIDVGNTHTVFGILVDEVLVHEFRMETRAQATSDEMMAFLSSLFSDRELSIDDVCGVGLACVVPTLLYPLSRVGRTLWGKDPFVGEHGEEPRTFRALEFLFHRRGDGMVTGLAVFRPLLPRYVPLFQALAVAEPKDD